MIRILCILTFSFLLILTISCSKAPEAENTNPEPLVLSRQYIELTDKNPTATLGILNGTPPYVVLQPKTLFLRDATVTNTRDIVYASIVNNETVVITRSDKVDGRVLANLLVVDKKGQKRVIIIVPDDGLMPNVEIAEEHLLTLYPDYWHSK